MSKTTCWNLRVSAEANQGGRKYMEDVTAVHFERVNSVEFASFAIFDGHGGREASHFAKDHLMGFIKKEKGFFSTRCELVKKAIRAGFLACHEAMAKKLPDWPKTVMGHPCTAGTTAALVIIRGNKLYVAHVGDSAVIMGVQRDADAPLETMTLTEDHKPEAPKERKRIEAHGGAVINKAGVNRVVWERPKLSHSGAVRRSTELDKIPFLAVARSLGDLWSWNAKTSSYVVSPDPDVEVHDLNKSGSRFIILASDGVTNMIRSHDAVNMVSEFEERKRRGEVAGTSAHELVRNALRRWSERNMRADNSSAIVVYIEKKKMEPKNCAQSYTESWESTNKNRHVKTPVSEKIVKKNGAVACAADRSAAVENEKKSDQRKQQSRLASAQEVEVDALESLQRLVSEVLGASSFDTAGRERLRSRVDSLGCA